MGCICITIVIYHFSNKNNVYSVSYTELQAALNFLTDENLIFSFQKNLHFKKIDKKEAKSEKKK